MMVKHMKCTWVTAVFCGLFALTAAAQDIDPPTRAARLGYANGTVSMQPAGIDEWAAAEINRPFTTGDYIYADQQSVAELNLDSAVIRIGEVTSFGFLNLNDQIAQLKLTEGDMYLRLYNLAPNQVYEVDTPNAAITLLREGVYRLRVDPNANTTFLVVREGAAEVNGGGQAFTLNPGNSAFLSGTDQLAYDVEQAPAPDVFDNWCTQRDEAYLQSPSAQYVPPSMIGYQDLDRNGTWTETPDYGPLWYPTTVDAGWAPYHEGHWVWIEPWGWTWVDAQRWAFAPCHYGRWVYWHERWAWAPGPIAVVYHQPVRPIYAPALVAWFGGAHWGVSVAVGGGGPSLGWLPLGFGEVYTPVYHCSPRYFEHVNVYNTRVVNTVNITNVYQTVYVQHNVYNQTFVNAAAPRAVVAMSATAFASGRPVQQSSVVVRQADFVRMRDARVITPAVAPTREAVAPFAGRPAAHPAASILSRPVIAHVAAPAQVAPFAARQGYLQQHAGQVHDFGAMHQSIQAQIRPVAAVHQAPQARPVDVRPGQRVGNVPVRNAARPYQQPAAAQSQPGGSQRNYAQTTARPAQTAQPVGGNGTNVHGVAPNMRREPAPEGGPQQPRYEQKPQQTYQKPAAEPRANEARPAAQPEPRREPAPQHAEAPPAHASEQHRTESHNDNNNHDKNHDNK